MASNTIDLNQAEQAVSSFLTNDEREHGYQSKTLKEHNRTRQIYLPAFPTKSYGPNDDLLLANVPVTRLATHEIIRREHAACSSNGSMMVDTYNYSTNNRFTLMEQDAEELAARLCVDRSIITFNAERLRRTCYSLLTMHESFRRNVLHKRDVALKEPVLSSKQMAVALEFYLQIDGMSCPYICGRWLENLVDFGMRKY